MNGVLDIYDLQAQLCQSLGHPVRLRIVHSLIDAAKSVNEISKLVTASQPVVSRHLAILRSAGILASQRKGQEVYYEIANPKVVEVCEMMRGILAERDAQQRDLIQRIQY